MNFEEALEIRDRLWEEYLIAERERIAKWLMELYCETRGWEADSWDDLPDEVQEKYYEQADQILRRG